MKYTALEMKLSADNNRLDKMYKQERLDHKKTYNEMDRSNMFLSKVIDALKDDKKKMSKELKQLRDEKQVFINKIDELTRINSEMVQRVNSESYVNERKL